MNAVEIEQTLSDLALQPFDPIEFPCAFLAAFGNKDTALKRLRDGNTNASEVEGSVLQRKHIRVNSCELGAVGIALETLCASPATAKVGKKPPARKVARTKA